MSEDKKFETIGKTITRITYWLFALKFIIFVSLPALVVLYFIDKPLWYAPIIGVGVFLLYRTLWRLVFSLFLKLSR